MSAYYKSCGLNLINNHLSDREFPTDKDLGNSLSHVDGSTTGPESDVPTGYGRNVRHTMEESLASDANIQPDLQQMVEVPPQRYWSLSEYLILSEDLIASRIRDFEKMLMQNFVDGMEDKSQKSAIIEKLDQTAWTWKLTEREVVALDNAVRKRRTEARIPKKAKKNANHGQPRTQPIRKSQRNKRKVNYKL